MNDKSRKFLSDISTAIKLIEEFTVDAPNFSQYTSDAKTKSAVERQLGIIGEAVNKLRKEDATLKLDNAQKIVDFRNRIVHAYDSVDDSIVWAILRLHLPSLKSEVSDLLEK